ncbi:pyridoxamine 5'-phosphate oxidase family protein [Bacteroidales bacterium OttesenSCG-928-L03]|nr:pyridoxamine 5'-phosphate oxidase family protein [Bacteroidales bacterium OttesenSCG-928-L03]
MVKLNDEMKKILGKLRIVPFATASKNGIPNVVPIGMIILQDDDETIWIVDNYMDKSISNVKENPNASLYIWDPETPDSYQIKGTVKIENSGADYEKAVKYAHEKRETLPAKNLLKLTITGIYYVTPGPNAGKKV